MIVSNKEEIFDWSILSYKLIGLHSSILKKNVKELNWWLVEPHYLGCQATYVEFLSVDPQIMQYTKAKYKIYFYNKLAEA